jgi:hypothetical protein
MARLSIGREVRKGRIFVERSEIMGITLHRRTGRGGWVNHWTNEPSTPNGAPKFWKGLLQAGRFKKVRAVNHAINYRGECLLENTSTKEVRIVMDRSRC